MSTINIWILLGITACILLIIFWRDRNAIWGGMTLGAIMGLIFTSFFALKGRGFDWYIISKAAVLGTLIGFLAELLGMMGNKIKKLSEK